MSALQTVLEWMGRMFGALVPPGDADPIHVTAWRRAVGGAIMLGYVLGFLFAVLVAVHVLWVCGFLPGLPGVAMADVVEKQINAVSWRERRDGTNLQAMVVDMRKTQVDATLKDTVMNLCVAIQNNNQEALNSANQTLSDLADQYYELHGRPYAAPSCDTVLIRPHRP